MIIIISQEHNPLYHRNSALPNGGSNANQEAVSIANNMQRSMVTGIKKEY